MKNGTPLRDRGNKSNGRGKILRAAALVLLATAGLALAFGTAVAAQAPSVVLHTVGTEGLDLKREFIGRVEPIQTVELRPQIPGEIAKVHFKEGAMVQEGELLFTLNPVEYQATVALRQAELTRAEASAATTARYHDRLRNIGRDGVSASNIDIAAGDAAQAKAQVAQARAQLRLAQIDLDRTKIKAPITGRIGKASVTRGNYVTPTSSVLATIVQVDPIRVSFAMPDREYLDILELSKTPRAATVRTTLRLTDGSAYPYPGERDFEDNVVEEQTGTIAMRLRFPNTQSRLLPGSMVRVNIASSSPTPDIMIPQEAIASDPQGDYVYVVDAENVAHRRDVVLGAASGVMRQVSSGLREGETLVLRGLQGVRDGMTVSPMTQPAEDADKKS